MRGFSKHSKFFAFCVTAVVFGSSVAARSQATLLLEEPYSYDGTFAGTGHSAVYLSRVCAETPTALRRCELGENGVVISRYHGVAGRDWIAVPLIPYLYAVNDSQDIPVYADNKLVTLLRSRYLENLDMVGPAAYQLAGSAYDRTTYGFRIATRPEQDDALIRMLNAGPNTESYKLLSHNCADFAKQIINFYYPHAIHRSIIADLGLMTPKQAAKSLAHFSKHHPQMQLTTFIIPQVPGLKRSKPVHGVIESLVLAKKYVTPVLLFHPAVVGAVEAAYWAGWRFNPAKGALIFDPSSPNTDSGLESPLTSAERRSYQDRVLMAKKASAEAQDRPNLESAESDAEPQIDAAGKPFLQMRVDGQPVQLGLCRGNMLRLSAPPELIEDLVLERLQQELKPGNPARTSALQVKTDWNLLEAARQARQDSLLSSNASSSLK
ncbi:MAG TPA: hypothetical protein VGU90_05915 [Terriglobales bacterium]|nr:hypothetical protein [Terriglobales bacterium]